MRYWTTYPLVTHPYNPELLTKDAVIAVATAAERAGFDGIGFTDHPAPTHRWLEAGGHDALDPFAALAFVAAVTDRIRLIPNIVVLPYRNPFLVAKSIATIDALSGGRFTLATATGYLKGEYKALGVDFAERNDLFDEAIEVLRGVWSTDDFAYEGRNFLAHGQTANPKPGSVPLWIGGNSRLSRRRVAQVADGWNPFPAPRQLATTAKTRPSRPPPTWRRCSTTCGSRSTRRAATAPTSTWRSGPRPGAAQPTTGSTPTLTARVWASWRDSGSRGRACRFPATRSRMRWRRSSATASW